MSFAVSYRRRKLGSTDDESTLSMMESLSVVIDVAAGFVAIDTDLEDASQEEVEAGECDGEQDG